MNTESNKENYRLLTYAPRINGITFFDSIESAEEAANELLKGNYCNDDIFILNVDIFEIVKEV